MSLLLLFNPGTAVTPTTAVKVRASGTFTARRPKIRAAGTFTARTVKVRSSGTFT